MKTFDEWMKSGDYLPDFMRDFHDQKKIFKRIDEIVINDENSDKEHKHTDMPSWITAHIYVIDFFLWYMGRRGYTLQKCRARQPFIDIGDDLRDFEKRQLEIFKAEMQAIKENNG